jgi:hypothetical protein
MSELRFLDTNYFFNTAYTLTASSSDTSFPVANLQKYHRGKVWRATAKAAEWVKLDLGSAKDVDSFAMLFPAAGHKFSASPTLKLQGNATDSWATPSVDITLSVDATYGIVTHFFSSTQTYRWWRVTLADASSTYAYVEIGKIVLAKATQLTQLPQLGFTESVSDPSLIDVTPYGQVYADVYPKRRAVKFSYEYITQADYQSLVTLYRTLGTTTPITVALDADASMFDKDRFLFYGRLTGALEASNPFTTFFNTGFSVEEWL